MGPYEEKHTLQVHCSFGADLQQVTCTLPGGEEGTESFHELEKQIELACREAGANGLALAVPAPEGSAEGFVCIFAKPERARVLKQLKTVESLVLSPVVPKEAGGSLLAAAVESKLHDALSATGWQTVRFGGERWLVRGSDLTHMLDADCTRSRSSEFDCFNLKFRLSGSHSDHHLFLKSFTTNDVVRKDVAAALPPALRERLQKEGRVDLEAHIGEDSLEPEAYEELIVATLPNLSPGVIKWVGTSLPPGDEHGPAWYRQYWKDRYSIELPREFLWVIVQFAGRGRDEAKTYPSSGECICLHVCTYCTTSRTSSYSKYKHVGTHPHAHKDVCARLCL